MFISLKLTTLAFAGSLISAVAHGQIKPLDAPLVYICTPEVEPNGKCAKGDAGLALLRGSQLQLVQRLFKLGSKASQAEVQKAVGSSSIQIADPGTTAYLDGKPIHRSAFIMDFAQGKGAEYALDGGVMATFANGYLMNIQFGGVQIPRANLYYASMECEPNCTGRISPAK
jgi:hypothetical protein